MVNDHCNSTYMMTYHHLIAKHFLKVGRKLRSEAKKPATHQGCQSMIDGPTSILGVFITLLCTYTKKNNNYNSTSVMAYHNLMAKHCLRVGRKSRSEAWNLPTWGCKSMVEGPIIMLRVFITL